MTMVELHDLAAPYVMDALDASELEAYEAHLKACAPCRIEVAELTEGAFVLAALAAEAPPSHLESRIMEKLGDLPGPAVTSTRPRRTWKWAFAAAAVLAVVFGAVVVFLDSRLDHAEAVAAVFKADDAQTVDFDSEVGNARFVYSNELGRGVFVDHGLEPPEGDRVYELWLVGETGPIPAGTFRPGSGDTLVVDGVEPGLTIALTEEPAGGSDRPTGEVLLSAEL